MENYLKLSELLFMINEQIPTLLNSFSELFIKNSFLHLLFPTAISQQFPNNYSKSCIGDFFLI